MVYSKKNCTLEKVEIRLMCNFGFGEYDHVPKNQVRLNPGASRLGKRKKPVIPISGVPACFVATLHFFII